MNLDKESIDEMVDYLNVVFSNLPEERKEEVRVLVEGCFQDDSKPHITGRTYAIPQDVEILDIESYNLPLVARVSNGAFEKAKYLDCDDTTKFQILDYDTNTGIQRPTTIITEDGRIFHDMGYLLRQNRLVRVADFLAGFSRNYKDMFEKSYRTSTEPTNSMVFGHPVK